MNGKGRPGEMHALEMQFLKYSAFIDCNYVYETCLDSSQVIMLRDRFCIFVYLYRSFLCICMKKKSPPKRIPKTIPHPFVHSLFRYIFRHRVGRVALALQPNGK